MWTDVPAVPCDMALPLSEPGPGLLWPVARPLMHVPPWAAFTVTPTCAAGGVCVLLPALAVLRFLH